MDMHPSQYQTPYMENSKTLPVRPVIPPTVMAQPPTIQQRSFGQKINQSFYITLLFLVISNSYRFINSLYSMWSNEPNAIVNEVGIPTTKGYILVSIGFFLITLWFLK